MGFTRAELESFRDVEVPDLLPPAGRPLRLLFVGINPGLWTAATQTHFAHPGNRFYPALLLGGVITEPVDPADGMSDADRTMMRERGIGISNVVHRATAKASELSAEELRAGGQQLVELVARERPKVVAIAGITAVGSRSGASGTSTAPSAKCSSALLATARATRVLPQPPTPVTVTRREVGARSRSTR